MTKIIAAILLIGVLVINADRAFFVGELSKTSLQAGAGNDKISLDSADVQIIVNLAGGQNEE